MHPKIKIAQYIPVYTSWTIYVGLWPDGTRYETSIGIWPLDVKFYYRIRVKLKNG